MTEKPIKTVGIFGSCVSRDAFNSKFIKTHKDYFRVVFYSAMTSMVSVTASPIDIDIQKLDHINVKKVNYRNEITKGYLDELKKAAPDILIFDFYTDARYGFTECRGSRIVSRVGKLVETGVLKEEDLGKVYNYRENTHELLSEWKKSVNWLASWLRTNLPDARIIINGIKGSRVVTDSEGNQVSEMNINAKKINKIWKQMDEYALKAFHASCISYDQDYTLDPEYPFGLGVALVHFHPVYYQDYFSRLLEIVYEEE